MSEKINLSGVKETLLLPLWGRAFETKKEKPLLIDNTAVKIIESIGYDFSVMEKKIHPLSRASWTARSIYFDEKIKSFLDKNPDGSIINVGCGLDTTYERVNNNKAVWYELDFPEVIEIRRKYMEESATRRFLPYSVFNDEWYVNVNNKKRAMLMIAGVIYYFEENQVKELFNKLAGEFEHCELVFDYSSPQGIKIANRKVIKNGGMDESAYLKWGIKNIYDIEKWNNKITVLQSMKMFHDHKKKYPLIKRLGMSITDAMAVMSLAHIEIENRLKIRSELK